jgi:hypothetical protein
MNSTQITLHNAPSSPELARRLQEKCEALEAIHPDVRHCRVKVSGPAPGESPEGFCVTLRVGLPGVEIAPAPQRHSIVGVAVNRAFALAAARLAELAPPRPPRTPRTTVRKPPGGNRWQPL